MVEVGCGRWCEGSSCRGRQRRFWEIGRERGRRCEGWLCHRSDLGRCLGENWLQLIVGWIVLLLCLLIRLVDVKLDPFVMAVGLRRCLR